MAYSYGSASLKKGGLQIYRHHPVWDDAFETIERKGIGHPDTICDMLAAEISRAYANYTFAHCDELILHHQIDKLMLIGGEIKVYFGGGEVIKPIRIIVAGRATYSYQGVAIPVEDIVREGIRSHFKKYFPLINFEKDIIIENRLTDHAGPGTITTSAGAIAHMFHPRNSSEVRGYEKFVANDTSYCIAYYPHSPLEAAVLSLEATLNSPKMKEKYPWLGTDIKIMAVRDKENVSVTACLPQISSAVHSLNEYKENLDAAGSFVDEYLTKALPDHHLDISLNTKDDYEKFNVYLTYSGASLSGDIGVVGRGNRANGLITANRPMSMEGTNGKNPRYYAGFIYANLTKRIAQEIFKELAEPSIVEIVSQNGGALLDPWKGRVVCAGDEGKIAEIYHASVKGIPEITRDFLDGKIVDY